MFGRQLVCLRPGQDVRRHEPFDQVFYESVAIENPEEQDSAFVRGLAELQARRTETGEGLEIFLDKNLDQFDPPVADEIMRLAKEVLEHA